MVDLTAMRGKVNLTSSPGWPRQKHTQATGRGWGGGSRWPGRYRQPASHAVIKSSARHLSSLICSAAAATALVIVGAANAGASAPSGAGEPSHVGLPLLRSSHYVGSLGVLGGRIVVGDETGGTTCRLALVQPLSLRALSDRVTPCNDPRLVGEEAAPVESLPRAGSQTGVVRIATWDSGTGTVHLGPVVMEYGNYSDSRPEWTYGGGYLWLYDVDTPSGAEVLRISLSTGQVLATVKMPGLSRLALSAGANGLWMGQSVETGWPSGKPRPPLLYFVGVHTTKPEVVPQAGLHVNWLLASGHGAWADVQAGKGSQSVETFSGPNTAPATVRVAGNGTQVPDNIGEGPFDAPPLMYAPGTGLVYAWPDWAQSSWPGTSQESIVKLDPATGRTAKMATFGTPFGSLQANLVYGGAAYVLMSNQGATEATLYRIPL